MPEVPINYLAVIVASVASMVLGFLWYGPLFGKQWMALSGIRPKSKPPMSTLIIALVATLVTAFVLTHSIVFAQAYLGVSGLNAGLQGGFWNWLGFVGPITLGMVLWEGKPWKLWILNNVYNLISLMLMGVIIAMWM